MNTLVFADNGCQILTIWILNQTGHNCIINAAHPTRGNIVRGDIVAHVPNGAISQPLQIEQSFLSGPKILLNVFCANKSIAIASQQNYCYLEAGHIQGEALSSKYIRANYVATPGSYLNKIPGEILWRIY